MSPCYRLVIRRRLTVGAFWLIGAFFMGGCNDNAPPNPSPSVVALPSVSAQSLSVSAQSLQEIQKITPDRTPEMPKNVRAYLDKVGTESGHLANEITELSDRSVEAASDRNMIFDDNWKTKSEVACDALVAVGRKLEGISPVPSECRNIQREVHDIGSLGVEMGRQFRKAVDEHDAAALKRYGSLADRGSTKGKKLAKDINSLTSRFAP